jgi:hypothetical protein
MDEEKSRKVEALLDLCKQQMEQFRHTQQIEWKANFGIWSLLAGAIYIVAKEPLSAHISRCYAALVLLVAIFIHALWLLKVHHSEVSDKRLWTQYRAEALPIIRDSKEALPEHEKPWERSPGEEIAWLSLEVTVTIILSAFLVAMLPK